MNTEKNKPSLAQRREALVAECGMQRTVAGRELANLRAPNVLTGGGLGRYLGGGKLKLMLAVAGVVLGIVAAKPARAMPLLATGISLFKMAQGVLSMIRARSV